MTTGLDLNRLTLIIGCVMLLPALCLSHGVKHSLFSAGTGIEAAYDDGRPMAFCDVVVFSPADPDNEYQSGITDPSGRFAFVPDTNGLWRVTVDDGMGHLVTAEVQAGPNERVSVGADTHVGRLTGGIVGVSVIFGLFGIYGLIRQRSGRARLAVGDGEGESECTSPKA
jgi:hypothetical protein